MKNEGWICPICKVANAPWVEQCSCRLGGKPAILEPMPHPHWMCEVTCGGNPFPPTPVIPPDHIPDAGKMVPATAPATQGGVK